MLSHVITLVVEAITRHHLNKATGANIDANWQNDFTLRMQKLYNVLGWICIGFAVFTILPLIIEHPNMIYLFVLLPFGLFFFGGAGILLILYYRNHQVIYDDTYIVVTGPLKKVITSRWDKIVDTQFNSTTGLLTLIDEDGQKLRMNQHLVGLQKFTTLLAKKTGLYTSIEF